MVNQMFVWPQSALLPIVLFDKSKYLKFFKLEKLA